MHLKDVELFCDIAARRSFSKAAEAHHLSQSSASHAVGLLERRLGTVLFDRSKRPLALTPAGEIYHEGCRELLQRFRAVEDRVRSLGDTLRGRVNVRAIYSVGLLQIDAVIRRFERRHPGAEVRVEYRHPDEVYAAVRSGEADLGLLSFPREGGEFSAIPWQNQPMAVVTPPDHRFAAAATVRAAELDGEDFVTFDAGLKVRRQIDRWLRSAGAAVNVVHEFDNVENVKRAIEIGAGIGLLPLPTVRRETDLGILAAVPLADVCWNRPLGIVHRRNKTLSATARGFVDLLTTDTVEPPGPPSGNGSSGNGAPGNGAPHNGSPGEPHP